MLITRELIDEKQIELDEFKKTVEAYALAFVTSREKYDKMRDELSKMALELKYGKE